MSASLVGSEMCIRDSSRAGHVLRNAAFNANASASGGGGAQGIAQPYTVSYTHLTLPTICSV
eukprot:1358723-Alexandrium_andersonii.AAC.1